MKKFLFECDFEKGHERFIGDGLDLSEVVALMLRQINLFYCNLLKNRPDLAESFRLELIKHMLDPKSPVWTKCDHNVKKNLFVLMMNPEKGGGS